MLGREVSRQLQHLGLKVHRCDRAPVEVADGEKFTQCDLADKAAVRKACEGCEAVIHLGGVSGPGFVFDPPIPAGTVAETNIIGTMNVLEAARELGVKRVVYASSVIVYWPVDRARSWPAATLAEDAPLDATETYGASKVAGEYLCRSYSAMGAVDSVSLRIGWVYGPGRTTGCPVKAMLQGIALDTPVDHRRDFVYVEDVARAIISATLREEDFGGISINVGGSHVSQEEVEEAVQRATGRRLEQKERSSTTVDPALPAMSLKTARRELGFSPRVSIKEGVWRYAEHLNVVKGARDISAFKGEWCFDKDACERAFEYYSFWGTLTETEARECATSTKVFVMAGDNMAEKMEVQLRAADTTRNVNFQYDMMLDGQPHEIDPLLRKRANNSIKMNPTGLWTHWWDEHRIIAEMPCVVRGQKLTHSLTRDIRDETMHCIEHVRDAETGELLLDCTLAFTRKRTTGAEEHEAEPDQKKRRV